MLDCKDWKTGAERNYSLNAGFYLSIRIDFENKAVMGKMFKEAAIVVFVHLLIMGNIFHIHFIPLSKHHFHSFQSQKNDTNLLLLFNYAI